MALPAGYSSDGSCDSDYMDGFDMGLPKRRYNHQQQGYNYQAPNNPFEKEDQFIASVINCDVAEVKRLITEGVNIDYKSEKHNNWTALMHACFLGNTEIVKCLLEHKASISEHNQLLNPLLCLCDSSNKNEYELLNCLELLLDYGADITATDWYRANALIHAVKSGHQKLVLKLIELGCKVDHKDSDGWTPIFYAVDCGHLELVQILMDAGADIKRLDNRFRSLHEIALSKQYKKIADIVNVVDLSDDIEDVIDDYTESKALSHYEHILCELPDGNKGRLYGFHKRAIQWIHGIELRSLVNLFLKKNVQLNEILTMNDEELKNLGVELSYDRKHLTNCVQKLHEHTWGPNCLSLSPDNEILTLNRVAQILLNIIQQVHIVNASTYFWRKNADQDVRNVNIYKEKGSYYIKLIEKETNLILKLVNDINERDRIVPSDLILPKRPSQFPIFRTIISVTLACFAFNCLRKHLTCKWNLFH